MKETLKSSLGAHSEALNFDNWRLDQRIKEASSGPELGIESDKSRTSLNKPAEKYTPPKWSEEAYVPPPPEHAPKKPMSEEARIKLGYAFIVLWFLLAGSPYFQYYLQR